MSQQLGEERGVAATRARGRSSDGFSVREGWRFKKVRASEDCVVRGRGHRARERAKRRGEEVQRRTRARVSRDIRRGRRLRGGFSEGFTGERARFGRDFVPIRDTLLVFHRTTRENGAQERV